ncbi:His Kinase A (phospho-acceptor) domain-containing protein [Desulforamulus putei DSM 12395]|uniref:histidine kinase n=2 Tax=Desulforamulus putei TaxID=74701 RepID=A0A1M4XLB6_9FIRM|nr:His Kinase A (phospho-acceptor) domain-containing protein [Desulforamulus putei DSM 12395]
MALKNLSLEIEKRIAADSRFFDELTRLNNELIMAKRELTQKNLELEAVNRELQRCNIELENAHNILQNREKLSIVGQMAAGMAHEVKNPLTAVRGMAQLLKERCAPEHSRLADAIIEETHRACRVINDYLQLARHKPPSLELQEVKKVVQEVWEIVEPLAGAAAQKTHGSI